MNNMCACERLKPIDYKSIALPAELQGQVSFERIFSLISQINQCIINIVTVCSLLTADSIIVSCRLFVTNLSVFCWCLNPASCGVFNSCFYLLKINYK